MGYERTTDTGTAETVDTAAQQFAAFLAAEDGDTQETALAQEQLDDTLDAEEGASDELGAEDDAPDETEHEAEADDGDEGEQDDEESEEPRYTVKVNGEEIEVTLEELRRGYSRDADYRRKTQALAEQRKALEAEYEAIRQERAQYAQLLTALEQQLQSGGVKEPDWDRLYQEDPVEWVRQRELWRSRQERLAAAQAEQQRLQQIAAQEQQARLAAYVQEQRERLFEALPELRDPEKAQQEHRRLRDYGQRLGFTEQELDSLYDHRAVLLLYKAARYDELMAKREALRPKPDGKATRTATPGSRVTPTEQQRKSAMRRQQRLEKTGSVHDAAAAIEALL